MNGLSVIVACVLLMQGCAETRGQAHAAVIDAVLEAGEGVIINPSGDGGAIRVTWAGKVRRTIYIDGVKFSFNNIARKERFYRHGMPGNGYHGIYNPGNARDIFPKVKGVFNGKRMLYIETGIDFSNIEGVRKFLMPNDLFNYYFNTEGIFVSVRAKRDRVISISVILVRAEGRPVNLRKIFNGSDGSVFIVGRE